MPTWNYAVAHVHGRAEIVADRAGDAWRRLQELIERFEGGRAAPWRLQLEGARLDAMVGAIVAFRIVIDRIDAKFKLSQNRDERTDRRRVAAALRKRSLCRRDRHRGTGWIVRPAAIDPVAQHARPFRQVAVGGALLPDAEPRGARRSRPDRCGSTMHRIKPSRIAAPGDRVVLRKDGLVWDIVVTAVADRRGDAADAARTLPGDAGEHRGPRRGSRPPQGARRAAQPDGRPARPS